MEPDNNDVKNVSTDNTSNDRPRRSFNNRSGDRKFGDRRPNDRKFTQDKKLDFEILTIKRVSRTMAGGRRMRFAVLVVAKLGNGIIGIGKAKSQEVSDAIRMAVQRTEKNPIKIPMYEDRTFSHASIGKFGATKVMLLPSAKEKGLRALGVARKLAKLAGITDGVIKILTKANAKHNICYAFIEAVKLLRSNKNSMKLNSNKKIAGGAV